jgi:hypothetical protein
MHQRLSELAARREVVAAQREEVVTRRAALSNESLILAAWHAELTVACRASIRRFQDLTDGRSREQVTVSPGSMIEETVTGRARG